MGMVHLSSQSLDEIEFDKLTCGILHTTYFYREIREDGKMLIDRCKFGSCEDLVRRCSDKTINLQILDSKDDRVIREWNKEQLDSCRRIFNKERSGIS